MKQRMSDLPSQKLEFCKPFTNMCLDLTELIEVRAMNNARSKLKTYPLVIVCLNTGALHLQVMHQYSTAAFILQWEHFVSIRGRPKWVHSDPGSQLKGAANIVAGGESLDLSALVEPEARCGTQWKFCPTASQWRNGRAEACVKALKQAVEAVEGGWRSLNYAELQC